MPVAICAELNSTSVDEEMPQGAYTAAGDGVVDGAGVGDVDATGEGEECGDGEPLATDVGLALAVALAPGNGRVELGEQLLTTIAT